MSVAPLPTHSRPSSGSRERWFPKPLGWRLLLSDRLLWLAVGISFLAHLILLAPRYGIQLPQPGDKALMVSFRTLGQSLQNSSSASQRDAVRRQADNPKTASELRKVPPFPASTLQPPITQAPTQPAFQSSTGSANMAAGGRRVTLTPGMKDYRYSQYLEDWRRKVERIGAMNYPEEARGQFFGSLVLSVALRPDGSIDRITIVRSSGNKILDDAAKRIVTMAAPFAPFPPDIRKETDYLDITRTWKFTRGNALETR